MSYLTTGSFLQHPGILGSVIDAEQKVADQGEKLWKKLPGIKEKDRHCQIHVEVGLNAHTAAAFILALHAFSCKQSSAIFTLPPLHYSKAPEVMKREASLSLTPASIRISWFSEE